MRIYLAAPYAARNKIAEYASELRQANFTVTSSWLEENHQISAGTVDAASDLDAAACKAHVAKDFADIERSDVLVLFTGKALFPTVAASQTTSGGRHVETGYALAKGVRVLVIGESENIFHRAMPREDDWHGALLRLVEWREEERDIADVAKAVSS